MTLQSHEDTRAYSNVYNYVKDGLGQAPEKWMADAAKEITAAGEEVKLLNYSWQPCFAFSLGSVWILTSVPADATQIQ